MEFAPGRTLARVIADEVSACRDVAAQILDALGEAHELGILHHGVFAPNSKARQRVVPAAPEPVTEDRARTTQKPRRVKSAEQTARIHRIPWADLPRKVFAIDALVRPECSGRMQLMPSSRRPRWRSASSTTSAWTRPGRRSPERSRTRSCSVRVVLGAATRASATSLSLSSTTILSAVFLPIPGTL